MRKIVLALFTLSLLPTQAHAARYIATLYEDSIQGGEDSGLVKLQLCVWYLGPDVKDTVQRRFVTILMDVLNDTPAQLATKAVDAIVAEAARVPNASSGTGVTANRTHGLIPAMNRGS